MTEKVNPVFSEDSIYEDLRPTTNKAYRFPKKEKDEDEVKNATRLLNVLKAMISALLLSAVVIFGGLISVPFLLNGNFVPSVTKETSSITLKDNTMTSQLMKDILILKEEIHKLKLSNISQSHKLEKQQMKIEKLENDLSTEKELRLNNTMTSQLIKDNLILKEEIHKLKLSNISQSHRLEKQQMKIEKLENDLLTEKELRLDLEKELKFVKNLTEQNKLFSSKFSNSLKELRSNDRVITASIERQAIQITNLNTTAKQLSKINTISSTKSPSTTNTPPEYCTHNIPVSVCLPCLCSALPYTKGRNIYTCDCRNLPTKLDCKDYYDSGYRLNGIYTLRPDGKTNITAYCDQTDSGGGWVVIQRRFDGSTGFYRDWGEYKNGFGDFRREYYLGNENIHILTKKRSELKIDVENFSNQKKFAKFDVFSIKGEDEGYQSSVAGYSGNAGSYFIRTNKVKFTTWDKDYDGWSGNCGSNNFGGWWFRSCHHYDYLNGVYFPTKAECPSHAGMEYLERLMKSMMKIRRRS